jgi:membrane protease YdiL (CAAX protease family)
MDLTAAKGLLYCLLGLFVLVAWARERQKRRLTGEPEKFWPGTTYAPAAAYYAAAAGAILITIAEATVEKRAGLTALQLKIPSMLIFQMLGASIVEEMLFRGFVAPGELVGRKLLALMIIGSLVFALIHNFDLRTAEGKLNALFAFITSLWLFVVRFNPLNPDRSLLPCFMAHTVRNLAVFGIKGAQGFISW